MSISKREGSMGSFEYNRFLDTLRVSTERIWQVFHDPPSNFHGPYWQRGTRWSGGLSESYVAAVETSIRSEFSQEYREFLRTLHTTDRPLHRRLHRHGETPQVIDVPSFTNWTTDLQATYLSIESTRETIARSVADTNSWHPKWGVRPEEATSRKSVIRDLIDAAPTLVPVFGHRYLVTGVKSYILSVVGSEIIIFADNFRQYLLNELATVLGVPIDVPSKTPSIPFWSDLIEAL